MIGTKPHNPDRVVEREGLTYRWYTNLKKGDYYHGKYKQLVEEGLPIVFQSDAYDHEGHRLDNDYLAVFVASDAQHSVRQALETITSGELEKACFWASHGQLITAFEHLLESGADEATRREVLATAYDKSAATSNSLGKHHGIKSWVDEAKRKWRFAKKLREGKVQIYLLPEDQPIRQ